MPMNVSKIALNIAFATGLFAATAARAATAECARESLLGRWTLVRAEDRVDGKWVKTFGDEPRGYFQFEPDGFVSVQFMQSPLENRVGRANAYLGYFGTFTVDEAKCAFTTSVEGAWLPAQAGSLQRRPFRVNNDVLTIGDDVTFRRTFHRASAR